MAKINQADRVAEVGLRPARPARRWLLVGGAALLVALLVSSRFGAVQATGSSEVNVLVLAIPTFLAGMLSFFSPCCLPILSAYFAFTFQAKRERVVLMTVAFFLGLATTMVLLGATASLVSQVLFTNLRVLTTIGGLMVIGFGMMSLLGKGFTGATLLNRPNATFIGTYVYGATFALGWTACVGPILGAVLTLLATQGIAVLQGALLAFVYALGIGAPLLVIATFYSRLGNGSRTWRVLRGRGVSLRLGGTTIHTHTTSIAGGLLLIAMGALLATGQFNIFSQWALRTPLTQWVLQLDEAIKQMFVGP